MSMLGTVSRLDKMKQDGTSMTAAEARKLYLEGVMDGMQIAGLMCPFDSNESSRERESWVMCQLLAHQDKLRQQMQKDTKLIIAHYGISESALHGMVFDTARLNSCGCELDEDGNVISDCLGRMLPGKTHQPWPFFEYTDSLGIIVPPEQYNQLSVMEKKRYRKRRFFEIEGFDRIYADDHKRLRWIIAEDIKNGNRINLRYAVASAGQYDLCYCRSDITQAIKEVESCQSCDKLMQKLIQRAKCGRITTEGMLNIAFMIDFCTLETCDFMQLKDEDYQRLEWLIESRMKGKFDEIFTNFDILTFQIDNNGSHLWGAIQNEDGRWHMKDVHNEDNQTRLSLRRAYLNHFLLGAVISYVVFILNEDEFLDMFLKTNAQQKHAILRLSETVDSVLRREKNSQLSQDERIRPVYLANYTISTTLQLLRQACNEEKAAEE